MGGKTGRRALFFGFLTLLTLFLLGCTGISSLECDVHLNKNGTGHVTVSSYSTYDLTDELPKYFYNRQNVHYTKAGDNYYVDFDLKNIYDITEYSRLRYTTANNATTYTYEDKLSFSLLSGPFASKSEDVPDFKYCVSMPDNSKITYLHFNGFEYPDAVGKNSYCVVVDGSASSHGQDITIVSVLALSGCAYGNPACDGNHTCINNTCVLKSGCSYNNPICDQNHSCINNTCVLKEGCAYGNPLCAPDQDCIDNRCVLKAGCGYNNPPCDESHYCLNNTCLLKRGCTYSNPACDSNHICINNSCTLKPGCAYDNPSCGQFEVCDKERNSCGINPAIIAVAIIAIIIVFVWMQRREITSYLSTMNKKETLAQPKVAAEKTAQKSELRKVITGASLLLKSGLALFFLIITLFLGWMIMTTPGTEPGESNIFALICFGPVALITGIFFVLITIWILSELKEESR